jgi:hypothetical protein
MKTRGCWQLWAANSIPGLCALHTCADHAFYMVHPASVSCAARESWIAPCVASPAADTRLLGGGLEVKAGSMRSMQPLHDRRTAKLTWAIWPGPVVSSSGVRLAADVYITASPDQRFSKGKFL